jgi:hypothetical protein
LWSWRSPSSSPRSSGPGSVPAPAWTPTSTRLLAVTAPAAAAALYVCDGAANELELAGRFGHIFLLEIDETTMLARIDTRENNDWGRIGDTREYLCRTLPEIQRRLREFGAIPIDARQPLDRVVDAILSRVG